jgi:hypothetical protein
LALAAGTVSALTFDTQPAEADFCQGKCSGH